MLAPAQVAQFKKEGFVIVPAFFGAYDVAAMQAEMERLHKMGAGRGCGLFQFRCAALQPR